MKKKIDEKMLQKWAEIILEIIKKNENMQFNQKPFDACHFLLSNCKMI